MKMKFMVESLPMRPVGRFLNVRRYGGGAFAAYPAAERKGEVRGEARGEANGRNAEKIEIAKKLKTKGTSIEEIVELTGLSKEEIEKL